MSRLLRIAAALALLACAVVLAARQGLPGLTWVRLDDLDKGRPLLRAALRDGETLTLTWHNSLFNQPVREVFYARDGVLVEDEVAFVDPQGAYQMPVSAADVADLFHTGGAFSARGLNRPYTQVIFRIGAIGDLHVQVRRQTIALLEEVGFGGRVQLAVRRPTLLEVLSSLFSRSPAAP